MTDWKNIPVGTRVRHLHDGYEGWIDGRTDCPDPGSYRIRLHGQTKRKTALPDNLKECKDVEAVFRSTKALCAKVISKPSNDDDKNKKERLTYWNDIVPLPYTIWALDEYDPSCSGDPIKFVNNGWIECSLEKFLPKLKEILYPGTPIAVVPSSEAGNYNPALREMIRRLAEDGHVDVTSCLTRHKTIPSSRRLRQDGRGGNSIVHHLDSISVADASQVSGKILLLLDNVVVTGATFMACRKVLLDARAAEVICLALGNERQKKPQEPSSQKNFSLDLSKFHKDSLP